jgi:hypothetical protein
MPQSLRTSVGKHRDSSRILPFFRMTLSVRPQFIKNAPILPLNS